MKKNCKKRGGDAGKYDYIWGSISILQTHRILLKKVREGGFNCNNYLKKFFYDRHIN